MTLKPCPFCGCENVYSIECRDDWRVGCEACEASVEGHDLKEAEEKWNRRAGEEK